MAYISKIRVPGVEAVYLIKDNEGRLMIAPEYSSSTTYSVDDYYVKDGLLWKVATGGTGAAVTGATTSVANELKSIKQSIAGAMHYIGVTSTELTDGSTITTLTPWPDRPISLTKTTDFVAGDVVLAPVKDKDSTERFHEFVWNGYEWSRFGSINPIGKMAYANTATGYTTITYNKSVYTGGTVTVKEYSEGASKYLKKDSVVSNVNVSNTTSASFVSKSVSKLGTTSVSVVYGTGAAVTDISTTKKGLDTTEIFGVGETGAAVTGVTSTNKKLGTTSIYGVQSEGVSIPVVTGGTAFVQVGASTTTSVVKGLGSTATPASAGYNNPFVGAAVDEADECLSWIEKPLVSTPIREAVSENVEVQNVSIGEITGIAKVASNSVTVATGALVNEDVDGGAMVAIGVTTTTDSFAKKAETGTTVATGGLVDKTDGDVIITSVTGTTESFAKKADKDVVVATGALDDNDVNGAEVIAGINITAVEGLVTGITYTENTGVLVEGTSGETGAIKVLTGINSSDREFQVPVVKGDDESHDVNVAITVYPD